MVPGVNSNAFLILPNYKYVRTNQKLKDEFPRLKEFKKTLQLVGIKVAKRSNCSV